MKSLRNFLFSLRGFSLPLSLFLILAVVVFLKQLVSCLRFVLAWSLRVLTCYGTNYTLAATAVGTLSLAGLSEPTALRDPLSLPSLSRAIIQVEHKEY